MVNKKFLNSKGLTLVELLGALALLGVVTTLAVTTLVQTIQYNNNAEADVSLRQQANLIATTIRNQYKGQDDFNVAYMEEENLVNVNGQTIKLPPSITVDLLEGPPNVELTLTNTENNNRQFSLSTIVRDRQTYVVKIEQSKDNNHEIPPPDDGDLANCGQISEFRDMNCLYEGDRPFYNHIKMINSLVKVNGEATFQNGFNDFKNSTLYVTDSTNISGNITYLKDNGKIFTGGDLTLDEINNIENSSIVEVKGDFTVNNNINNIRDNSDIIVGGDFTLNDLNNIQGSTIKVGGDFNSSGNINNLKEQTVLMIGGNLNNQNNMLHINGLQQGSNIVVYQDAYLSSINSIHEDSKVCVFGNIYGYDADNDSRVYESSDAENACSEYVLE
ncbi:prepilin-type N-terminal cleavage/methylation domain-containing protein [Aquibacillus sediminis]|uniref:prepilin-type N-terminal cleavage/methylation domain-containing protein n=1 Tax=Aquibacillus sediminis TaxID=2574734 RepID=UPI0011094233|nr:prepilin-type N-terminal cleavage/methylation domain-containing protein [Aquibacillus sediminis]